MKFIEKHVYSILLVSLIINCLAILLIVFNTNKEKGNNVYVFNPHGSVLNCDSISDIELKRTNIINSFAEKYNYHTYLEIGQGVAADNFYWISCKTKVGVDPDSSLNAQFKITSDEFFKQNKSNFDLVFIDGLHEKDQVYRDIINALKCLKKNGTIVIHDCSPSTEAMQKVPRVQEAWTGDVWKAWVKLRSERSDLEMYVIDANYGCGVIRQGKQNTIQVPENITYQYFNENRKSLLNLISINEFLKYLKK